MKEVEWDVTVTIQPVAPFPGKAILLGFEQTHGSCQMT